MSIQDRDYMRRRREEDENTPSVRMQRSAEDALSKYGRWVVIAVIVLVVVTIVVLAVTKPR